MKTALSKKNFRSEKRLVVKYTYHSTEYKILVEKMRKISTKMFIMHSLCIFIVLELVS